MSDTSKFTRWRIYLRSDGTWTYDPLGINGEHYVDRFYPVEYVLPFGYRGVFQVAWGVQGAPPLQIVNDKIVVYIPATGIVETSSAHFLDSDTVALGRESFYFEHDGERTAIAVTAPGKRDQVGIIRGPTSCPSVHGRCESFFMGSGEDWHAIISTKCQTGEDIARVVTSGHNCFEVPPGSTQPVSEIVQPQGKPAIRADTFHGRTINGRSVVLSGKSTGVNSWRYEGPESNADESTLTLELRKYIETTLAANTDIQAPQGECAQEQMTSLMKLAAASPYRFTRAPFSNTIKAAFRPDGKPGCKTCPSIVFFRRDESWKLAGCDDDAGDGRQSETGARFIGIAAVRDPANVRAESQFGSISEPSFQNSTPVFLREDGTWDLTGYQAFNLSQGAYAGHDINGNELAFEINDRGLRTWRIAASKALEVHVDTVTPGLKQALDRYIELLSSGKVEEFVAHGGDGAAYERYFLLKSCEKPTGDAGTDNLCEGLSEKLKTLIQQVLEQVDVSAAVQELKRLRSATPRISRIVFSPDFEALYTLPPKEPGGPQIIRRMIGHGSTWYFDPDASRE